MFVRTLKVYTLIIWELIRRNIGWFWFGLILIAVALFLQLKFNLFYPTNVVRIGLVGTYQEHDMPEEVTRLLSENLLQTDENGRVKPSLVWGWETNHDATEFKFKLKKDLFWSDGTPIKASEIIFNIPNTQISYPDENSIQFNLKEPYSPLHSLLTKPIFKKGTLTGTGPYKITNIEKSRIFITKIILKSDKKDLPVIQIRFYPNEKVAVSGFNLGEVQSFMGASSATKFLENPKAGIIQRVDFTKIVTILFNGADPLLSNRSLRQALAYITPKIAQEVEANNSYPPTLWAYDPKAKKYLSNPEEAKLALGRAKAMLSDDKLKAEIILTTTPNLEDAGKVIAKSWESLGFDVKLRIESGIPQNFQSLLITQSIPQDPDQYFLWHATQSKTNLSKYDSKRADKDLEDGRKVINEEDRKVLYFDFQKTLLEDAPAVFLYFPKYNVVYLKSIKDRLDKVLDINSQR